MNEQEKAVFDAQEESLRDSAADAIVLDFLKANEDIKITIEIDWVDDLGIRAVMMSTETDSFARSGHPESVTEALVRLIEKAKPRIAEYRENRARVEKAWAELDDEDDN